MLREKRFFIAPSKYIQYAGALSDLKSFSSNLGKKIYAIVCRFAVNHYKEKLITGFSQEEITVIQFGGECSMVEIDKHKDSVIKEKYDIVVGMGGGKTIDTAKAVGFYSNVPVIIIPTTASRYFYLNVLFC
jgi:glycerol dehydrogenase